VEWPAPAVASYDARGNFATIAVAPAQGTLDVLGDSVVIVYEQDGVGHEVLYDVVGPH
jgi:hypothetical protein